MKTIGRRLAGLYPPSNTREEFLVRSLHFEMTRDVGGQVWMLFGAVALVRLAAGANVASMLLARCAQRQGEFGARCAGGAQARPGLPGFGRESVGLAGRPSSIRSLRCGPAENAASAAAPADWAARATPCFSV